MMPFEYFKNEVQKKEPDMELARSLIKDMNERIEKSLLLDFEMFSKIIFENVYDALRDFCDALLACDGFKSYSHQASIAYLQKKGFDISIIEEFDQIMYKRNGSKYYGRKIGKSDARQIIEFYNLIKPRIEEIVKKI